MGTLSVFQERKTLFLEMIERASPGVYSENQKNRIYLKFLWHRTIHGTYMIDYIQYRFYERNKLGREQFIEYQRLHEIMKACNDPTKDEVFDIKTKFNSVFGDSLGREWLDISQASYQEFERFALKHVRVFVKPTIGSFGHGVRICDWAETDNLRSEYEDLKKEEALLETVLDQHPTLQAFNQSSLNTLRVVTMVDRQGVPHVLSAVLRTGRAGKVADNFHHNGIASGVDVETGIVYTTGIDRNFQRYVIHPDSGAQFCGFRVPLWSNVLALVKKLALVVPETRYVGWDIALTNDNRVVCIEGNRGADPDVTQTTDQQGNYHLYKQYI